MKQKRDRAPQPEHLKNPRFAFSALAVTVLTFAFVRRLTEEAVEEGPFVSLAIVFAIALICWALAKIRASDVSPAFNIIVRMVAVVLGGYSLAAGITYPKGVSDEADLILVVFQLGSIFSAAAAVAAFRWPIFVLIPGLFVMAKKGTGEFLFGVSISHTDYIVVVELGILLGAGMLILEASRRLSAKWKRLSTDKEAIENTTALLVVAGIAVHFANYFYSAHAKMVLDGGPWVWLLENPTAVLTPNAWVGGFLPSAHLEPVAMATARFGAWAQIPINFATLFGQLAALLMLFRRKLMIAITLFYDLTHIVIYLVTGIFFWKWILLNLALVAAIRLLPPFVEGKRIVFAAMALLLLSPQAFTIVRLGWYDTPAQTVSEAFAVTEDGREVRVPSNYFGTISVTAAQHRLGRVEAGHYPTSTWGTVYSLSDFQRGNSSCAFGPEEPWLFERKTSDVAKQLQLAHAYSVQRHQRSGDYKYDRFPHHIWSNPWYFDEFAELVPEEITHYVYETRSECVGVSDGKPSVRRDKVSRFNVVPVSVQEIE